MRLSIICFIEKFEVQKLFSVIVHVGSAIKITHRFENALGGYLKDFEIQYVNLLALNSRLSVLIMFADNINFIEIR